MRIHDSHALALKRDAIYAGGLKFAGLGLDFATGFGTVQDLALVRTCDAVVVPETLWYVRPSELVVHVQILSCDSLEMLPWAFQNRDHNPRLIRKSDGAS